MEQRKPVIVGIDPGTTTGYAILDTNGNLIAADSSKNLGLAELINETTKYGRIILVGTDKQKIPDLVHRFASKLGAKIINPKEDLRADEKRIISKEYKTKNEHEDDALASALVAYKDVRHLIEKIERLDTGRKDIVKEFVLKNGVSISRALQMLNPEITETKQEIRRLNQEVNIDKLISRLRMYEREIYILRKQISALKEKRINNRFTDRRKNFNLNKKIDDLFRFKEKRLQAYSTLLRNKDVQIEKLKRRIDGLEHLIVNSKEFYVLKKLRNLGYEEFKGIKSSAGIDDGDILLVDDVNILSEKTILEIEGRVDAIVYKMPVSKNIRMPFGFSFISADRMNIADYGNFAAVRKEELDRELGRKESLLKVISDYKMKKDTNWIMHRN